MPPPYPLNEEFLIQDTETLKVFTDERRIRILHLLSDQALSVKEVGEQLDIPASKLYYHINLMEKAGVLQVVETRIVSGIIEKIYYVSAKFFRPGPDLLNATDAAILLEDMVLSTLDSMRQDLLASFSSGAAQLNQNLPVHQRSSIAYSSLRLTPENVARFQEELTALFERYGHDDEPEAQVHGFFFVRFPQAREQTSN
jgi:DNA-binding transcriptional ArsR family regulator